MVRGRWESNKRERHAVIRKAEIFWPTLGFKGTTFDSFWFSAGGFLTSAFAVPGYNGTDAETKTKPKSNLIKERSLKR